MLDRGSPRPEFLSTPSARRATACIMCKACRFVYFYPRPPRGGRLVQLPALLPNGIISIHALREEGDLESAAGSAGQEDFYPRPPRGGRPGLTAWPAVTAMLISIHALREEGDKLTETRLRLNTDFYPRPPRGGRPRVVLIINQFVIISIHALREEGDQMAQAMGAELVVFLSTPSARRATLWLSMSMMITAYFYPRPPRGGRPRIACAWPTSFIFLSTPSARRATWQLLRLPDHRSISIHALREEGDAISPINPTSGGNFYPRPPRGGRLFKRSKQLRPAQFLSTPSARRATLVRDFCYCGQIISIHALREEGDPFKAGQHW